MGVGAVTAGAWEGPLPCGSQEALARWRGGFASIHAFSLPTVRRVTDFPSCNRIGNLLFLTASWHRVLGARPLCAAASSMRRSRKDVSVFMQACYRRSPSIVNCSPKAFTDLPIGGYGVSPPRTYIGGGDAMTAAIYQEPLVIDPNDMSEPDGTEVQIVGIVIKVQAEMPYS